jgi:hypothetical protein
MRRDIFLNKAIDTIQQGCIFSGALSDGINKSVYGLIITPRCDIQNSKVLYVNYLPITSLSDWKSKDLVEIYRVSEGAKQRKELEKKLEKAQKNLKLDPQYRLTTEDLNAIFPSHKDKKLKDDLIRYWDIFDDTKCAQSVLKWSNYKSKLGELSHGKMERYLLLEGWNEQKSAFYVIHLTQIKRITLRTAQLLVKGIKPNMVNSEIEDLYIDDIPAATTYKVVTQLNSPYIEYVCQKFSNAFFRIGIEDWPHDIVDLIK